MISSLSHVSFPSFPTRVRMKNRFCIPFTVKNFFFVFFSSFLHSHSNLTQKSQSFVLALNSFSVTVFTYYEACFSIFCFVCTSQPVKSFDLLFWTSGDNFDWCVVDLVKLYTVKGDWNTLQYNTAWNIAIHLRLHDMALKAKRDNIYLLKHRRNYTTLSVSLQYECCVGVYVGY